MSNPSPIPPAGQDPEINDPVWRLLGRARPVTAHPDFVHRVLKSLEPGRPSAPASPAWWRRLFAPDLRPALAVASLVLLGLAAWTASEMAHRSPAIAPATHPYPPHQATPGDDAESILQAIAAEIAFLENIDHLLAPEDGLDLEETDLSLVLF
ncbi:MAG: hypothetical protein ACKV19_28415 [Verrucomicrobiales bacterium]